MSIKTNIYQNELSIKLIEMTNCQQTYIHRHKNVAGINRLMAFQSYPLDSWISPGFYWGSCYLIFSFMCMFCRSLFGFFFGVLFLLAIVLSVLLWYTDSDYPFSIFKLFSNIHICERLYRAIHRKKYTLFLIRSHVVMINVGYRKYEEKMLSV